MTKFLLDSADIEDFKRWRPYINGMTTNPSLFEKAGTTPMELYGELVKQKVPDHFKLFIQVTDKDNLITDRVSSVPQIIYKVPLVEEQYKYLTKLILDYHETCGTMTYDIIQLQMAINLKADYCIILYHKNEDPMFGLDAVTLKENNKSDIQLIGASFRNKSEVTGAILDGMDYITVSANVLEECFYNEKAIEDYDKLYT